MMIKQRSIAFALTAVFSCASAFALPAVNIDGSNTVRIYMAGSSSLRNVVFGVVLNGICGSSTTNASTTLYNVVESSPGAAPSFFNNYWAISCILLAGNPLGLPAGTPIAFFKSDAGGSAQGVFPVAFSTALRQVQPVPLAGCVNTVISNRAYTGCPNTRSAVPDLGISDIEPGRFEGVNMPSDPLDFEDDLYPQSGLNRDQLGQLTIRPVVQNVFGLVVNTRLYNAMFTKQGLASKREAGGGFCTPASSDENCIPSIGRGIARSYLQGSETNWRLLVGSAGPLVNTQVNICSRVRGSGTQAAAELDLMTYPCNAFPLASARWDFSNSAAPRESSSLINAMADGTSFANHLIENMGGGAGTGPMPTGSQFFFEGPGSGEVMACLIAANEAQGYALGHLSRENPDTARFKFVKLEGALPKRDSAKAGDYDYLFETTVQYRTSAFNALSANQRIFITGFRTEIASPAGLSRVAPANQNGVAALPNSYAGAFGTGTPAEIAFGSRLTRASNSCNPLTAVK